MGRGLEAGVERATVSSEQERARLEKIGALPPRCGAEIEDVADVVSRREVEQQLVASAAKLSEDAFKAIWDNPDDAVYDEL
jgi:hypothetical protein